MSHPVCLLPLPSGRADMAYPLAQAVDPGLTIARWRGIVRRAAVAGRTAGIMVAETPRGYVRGLFVYRVRGGRSGRRVLEVERFSVPDVIGSAAVARLLLAEIDRLAGRHGCTTIDIVLGETAVGLVGQLPLPFRALADRVRRLSLDRPAATSGIPPRAPRS